MKAAPGSIVMAEIKKGTEIVNRTYVLVFQNDKKKEVYLRTQTTQDAQAPAVALVEKRGLRALSLSPEEWPLDKYLSYLASFTRDTKIGYSGTFIGGTL